MLIEGKEARLEQAYERSCTYMLRRLGLQLAKVEGSSWQCERPRGQHSTERGSIVLQQKANRFDALDAGELGGRPV